MVGFSCGPYMLAVPLYSSKFSCNTYFTLVLSSFLKEKGFPILSCYGKILETELNPICISYVAKVID